MSLEQDMNKLWNAVVAQGTAMQAMQPLVERIKTAVNAQANGLRNLELRIGQMEALIVSARTHQSRPQPQQPMRTINSNVRALPSVNPSRAAFVETDDASADGDFEYEDDEQEAG